MATNKTEDRRIDQFFSGPSARADEWRGLLEAAKAWAGGSSDRTKFEQQQAVDRNKSGKSVFRTAAE